MTVDQFREASPADRLAEILRRIEAGQTLYVCTYTRATRVTKRTLVSWRKSGLELFRADARSLYMARGRAWDCIDGCALRFTEKA